MAEKKKFEYDDFSYDAYQESDIVTQAKNALDTHLAAKPGAYQSQWQNQLNDVLDKIMNRDKFTYDLNGDALYQQYKDKFTQQGKMAMGDAIGQASAMTGGYGNSYAQSVGQQMYQKELQNLNDIVPELYQMALSKYDMDTQNLHKQQALLGQMDDRDYSKYRDTVADWNTEKGYLADRYDAERNLDYSKYSADKEFAYGQYSDNRNLAYTDHRNTIEDEQWRISHDAQVAATAAQLAYQQERDQKEFLQRVTEFKHQQEMDKAKLGVTGASGTPQTETFDGVHGYDNGSLSSAQIKELQKALGVTADGMYGYASHEAAGGLTAEEAYAEYVGGGKETTKGWSNYSNEQYNENSKANGGSHYETVLSDLKKMKAEGTSNKEVQAYLEEMVGNSYITQANYMSLYNKYRDGKIK